MNLLNDKVAVVTGAGRGIGRAVAIAYARMGADVVCVYRTEENSAKVAAEVEELGRKAWAKAVDVSDTAAVEAAAKEILEQAGKVDILVNNAGSAFHSLFVDTTLEDWERVLRINLTGPLLIGQAAAAFTHFFGAEPPREKDAELRERLLA